MPRTARSNTAASARKAPPAGAPALAVWRARHVQRRGRATVVLAARALLRRRLRSVPRREHLCQPPARHAADGVPVGGRRVLVQPASVSGHEPLHAAAQPGERGRRAAAWRARPAARAPVAGAREEGGHAGGA
ncbi:hypothetical protein FGB62_267g09 [Gracilaria domingensis]|nr:hypothetical protein FGB62_267g09 [Gracilaria domingensis]